MSISNIILQMFTSMPYINIDIFHETCLGLAFEKNGKRYIAFDLQFSIYICNTLSHINKNVQSNTKKNLVILIYFQFQSIAYDSYLLLLYKERVNILCFGILLFLIF